MGNVGPEGTTGPLPSGESLRPDWLKCQREHRADVEPRALISALVRPQNGRCLPRCAICPNLAGTMAHDGRPRSIRCLLSGSGKACREESRGVNRSPFKSVTWSFDEVVLMAVLLGTCIHRPCGGGVADESRARTCSGPCERRYSLARRHADRSRMGHPGVQRSVRL